MITYNIYQDGKLIESFPHQISDIKPFGWMLRNQGNSVSHAIRYEGWKVEEVNEETGTKTYWKP